MNHWRMTFKLNGRTSLPQQSSGLQSQQRQSGLITAEELYRVTFQWVKGTKQAVCWKKTNNLQLIMKQPKTPRVTLFCQLRLFLGYFVVVDASTMPQWVRLPSSHICCPQDTHCQGWLFSTSMSGFATLAPLQQWLIILDSSRTPVC